MRLSFIALALVIAGGGCTTSTGTQVTRNSIETAAANIDYGDSSSQTLLNKAWAAYEKKDYPALFAYTHRCVELYGPEGKRMNDALTGFEPEPTAATLWALNDVGTCLWIMAHSYEDLKMYPEAVAAYRKLADDYQYAQCWDPKGWFWRPAEGAALQAEKMKNWH